MFALGFTYYGIGLLSAGRAYVGGEGLWSKSQKDMVYALARYALSQRRRLPDLSRIAHRDSG
ncbi:hypothetical protein LP419_22555 [Massilia sp. H-1]|nr:hypothetical protein LP419_22555 [Massilia sp. H-1]